MFLVIVLLLLTAVAIQAQHEFNSHCKDPPPTNIPGSVFLSFFIQLFICFIP